MIERTLVLGEASTRMAAAAEQLAAAGVEDRRWAAIVGRTRLVRAWWYGDVFGHQESVNLLFDYAHREHWRRGELQDGVDEPAFEPVAGPSAVVDGQVVRFGAGQAVDHVDLSRRGSELGPVAVSRPVRAWTSRWGVAAGVPRRGDVRVPVCGGG